MEIVVTAGAGCGPTELAAFDRALAEAGIGNLNLIPLSSVIPAQSMVILGQPRVTEDQWGHRAYVVIAERRESRSGDQAWAGLGWVIDEDTGAGLFVEHVGQSDAAVRADITASLEAMKSWRARTLGPIHMLTMGATCSCEPVCSLVAAVFRIEGWGPDDPFQAAEQGVLSLDVTGRS